MLRTSSTSPVASKCRRQSWAGPALAEDPVAYCLRVVFGPVSGCTYCSLQWVRYWVCANAMECTGFLQHLGALLASLYVCFYLIHILRAAHAVAECYSDNNDVRQWVKGRPWSDSAGRHGVAEGGLDDL